MKNVLKDNYSYLGNTFKKVMLRSMNFVEIYPEFVDEFNK